jgi:hypothetical protein
MPFGYTIVASDRFEGDFALAERPGAAISDPERGLSSRITDVLDDLAAIPVEAETPLGLRLGSERRQVARGLRSLVDGVNAATVTPEAAECQSYEIWGRFKERREQIGQCRMYVAGLDAQGNLIRGRNGYEDIVYQFGSGTPSPEQIALKGAVDRALAVVRAVVVPLNTRRARDRNDYIRDLVGVAKTGLEYGQVLLATGELASFKQTVVLREAGALKNSYVRRLGFWAALLALAAVLVFMAIDWNWTGNANPPRYDRYGLFAHFGVYAHRFQNLLLIAVGAAGGAWLAFLIRRPTLAFEDLTQLDEDLLSPAIRMIYTMLLSPLVGLLFWTGMVSVKMGGFDSNVAHSGLVCVVIGALSGIASRAVATAVGRRADDLAAAIGGTAKPSA